MSRCVGSTVPPAVLGRYGAAAAGLRWVPVGGGFSGAGVWRGDGENGRAVLALKAWPPTMPAARLAQIHLWMRQAGHVPFVPAVLTAGSSGTVVTEAGRLWDLSRWMPGAADFRTHPTPARLTNAAAALARLHRAWRPAVPAFAPCPGVARRLALLSDWQAACRMQTRHPLLADAARRAAAAVPRLADAAVAALLPWATRPVPVQPCLCDVWHDHVLFTGDAVTGVIDYGAMKVDHVAVDLARLLGDLVGDDDSRFAAALAAYRAAGGTPDVPDAFVRLLDRTGAVCAALFWLRRLPAETTPSPDPAAVAARLHAVAARLEQLPAV